MITIERIYEPSTRRGARFLVDRLWPRGIRKEVLALDGWVRDAAPSTELRQWFHHEPAKWAEFRQRYRAELDRNPAGWQPVLDAARRGNVILLYSARDPEHNNAVVLKHYLERRLRSGSAPSSRTAARGHPKRVAAR